MKRFNFNQLLWFLVLVALLLSIGFLFFSGKIFYLVATKMRIYIILTLIFLFIVSIVQMFEIFTVPSRGGIKKGYIFFLLLIISFIIVSKIDILKNSLKIKGVIIEHNNHSHGNGHKHVISEVDNNNIIVKKSNFHNVIEAINENLDKYLDKEITIEGLVYNENISEGNFVITQIDMNCCMVDSNFLGITCVGEFGDKLKTGDYIVAKGKIKGIEHNGSMIGAIYIDELENIHE